jgi:hypothetical protein
MTDKTPQPEQIPIGPEAFPALEVLNEILDQIDAARAQEQRDQEGREAT